MSASILFCATCGAANGLDNSTCFACGQSLTLTLEHSTSALQNQKFLNGRYQVLAKIGRGGFGAVYKVADAHFEHRLLALKEMNANQESIDGEVQDRIDAVERFKHEASLLAGLMHPNLPRIYDHFFEDGRWYLVMDFISGETLEDYLEHAQADHLSLNEVLDISEQLCAVLEYLHKQQPPIIFRDLKPANVMRTPEGHLYLIDFGIARYFKPGQQKDTMALGSPGYAAPEQYGRTQSTPRSDIYSLGALLHQLLSGEDPSIRPFFFLPLTQSVAPAVLQTLIAHMVQMDEAQRPTSIKAIKQVLEQARDILYRGSLPAPSINSVPVTPISSHSTKKYRTAPRPFQLKTGEVLAMVEEHNNLVTSLAWSPQGDVLAIGSYDQTVSIWDAVLAKTIQRCKLRKRLMAATPHVHAISWSSDGNYLAIGSNDRCLYIWDIVDAEALLNYAQYKDAVIAVAWSPSGKYIASAAGNTVYVWNALATDEKPELYCTYTWHNDTVQSLSWSPDERYLASGGRDGQVIVAEHILNSKNVVARTLYKDHCAMVQTVAWSPDGTRIASTGVDLTVQIWDPLTGNRLLTYNEHTMTIKALAWSPDSTKIVSADLDGAYIWDTLTGKRLFVYTGHEYGVQAVAWSPNGSKIASAGQDKAVHIWRAS